MSFEDQQQMSSAEAQAQTLLREEFGPNFKNYRSIVIPKLPGYSAIIITINQSQFKMYTFGSIELEVETQIIKFLQAQGLQGSVSPSIQQMSRLLEFFALP